MPSWALPDLPARANNPPNYSRTWILTRDESASPLPVISAASGLSLTQFDPEERVRLTSPDLWLRWFSPQRQLCCGITGKRGWVRSVPAPRTPPSVRGAAIRVLSPGHSPAASSALSLPRQAHKRSSRWLFPKPELLISTSPNCLFSPLR